MRIVRTTLAAMLAVVLFVSLAALALATPPGGSPAARLRASPARRSRRPAGRSVQRPAAAHRARQAVSTAAHRAPVRRPTGRPVWPRWWRRRRIARGAKRMPARRRPVPPVSQSAIGFPRSARWPRVAVDRRSAACALGFAVIVLLGFEDGGYYAPSWTWTGIALGAVAVHPAPGSSCSDAIATRLVLVGRARRPHPVDAALGDLGSRRHRGAARVGARSGLSRRARRAADCRAPRYLTRPARRRPRGNRHARALRARRAHRLAGGARPLPGRTSQGARRLRERARTARGSRGRSRARPHVGAPRPNRALTARRSGRRVARRARPDLEPRCDARAPCRAGRTRRDAASHRDASSLRSQLASSSSCSSPCRVRPSATDPRTGTSPSPMPPTTRCSDPVPGASTTSGSSDAASPAFVRDAHSLYLETAAELGVVGLALLLCALGAPLVAAVAARDRTRVATAAAAYVVFLVHAGLDWDWEMPVTVLAGLACGAAVLAGVRETRLSVR